MAVPGIQVQGVGQAINRSPAPETRESQFEVILQESEVRIAAPENITIRDVDGGIDIRSLSSLNINHNPMFQELKQRLVAHYRDSIRIKPLLHPEKSKAWRLVLYTSLQKLLREVVFTQDRVLQEKCLERVFKWYYEKVQRPVVTPPITYPEVKDSISQREGTEKSLSPVPEDRLKKYSRRQITSATTRSDLPVSRPVTAPQHLRVEESVEKTASVAFTGLGDPVTESRADFGTTFLHYEPFDQEEDKLAEERIQQVLNKAQSDDRVEREMREKVYVWTSARARQEEEFTRRSEGTRFASRFEVRGVRSRPSTAIRTRVQSKSPIRAKTPIVDLTQDPIPVQSEVEEGDLNTPEPEAQYFQNYGKIAKMRVLHGDLIQAKENHDENQKRFFESRLELVSMSAYTRKEVKRPVTASARPASASRQRPVLTGGLKIETRPLSAPRGNQLEEISEVKIRLAKHGIPCRYENLAAALLVPEDLPPSKLTAENLPPDGARLMDNPFLKLKKKKKKGSKKKKGKKGR